ncbi:MAG: asparagine synthase (glutamine-hydrolyzing) [Gammaproteobacteria bacterium]|nr:asparagine synthase (glutamine-hydrolyzing) [Gammaproteobacteria bacterium]
MCGVVAILDSRGKPASPVEIGRVLETIRHRGPDGTGTWCEVDGVGLGHVRLAVIDLSRDSDQPFVSNDGSLVITYNGEIFNYLELRTELAGLGHTFRTRSDTEVLLAAYAEWGHDVCSHLNGMWAFAIYDVRKRELFCSRDRFGIKPLYYASVGERLLLASEVKALLAAEPTLAQLEPSAVSKLMRASLSGHVPEHFCRGVRRLPAAHNMVAKPGGEPVFTRYWDYPASIDRGVTFEAACEQFRALLVDAVRLRMRSDVPVGTTLSSGMDSSSLVCLLRTFYDGEHQAFTAKFADSEDDESVAAGRLARELGMSHFSIPTSVDFLPTLERVVHHMDGPTECPATLPLWNIMRAMRERIVVCLEGQGADELLAGYYQTVAPAAVVDAVRLGQWRQAGVALRAALLPRDEGRRGGIRGGLEFARAAVPSAHRAFRRIRGDEPVYSGVLAGGPDAQPERDNAPHYREALSNHLRRSHERGLATLLHYGDAISMAHSIESRLPFLDHRLVEFVFGLPGEYKLRDGRGKALLREAVRGDVPDSILRDRPKLGFVVPIRDWFRSEPDATVLPVLLSRRCRERGLFNPKALERALRRHISGRVDLSNQIFRWLTLELWCRDALDGA